MDSVIPNLSEYMLQFFPSLFEHVEHKLGAEFKFIPTFWSVKKKDAILRIGISQGSKNIKNLNHSRHTEMISLHLSMGAHKKLISFDAIYKSHIYKQILRSVFLSHSCDSQVVGANRNVCQSNISFEFDQDMQILETNLSQDE